MITINLLSLIFNKIKFVKEAVVSIIVGQVVRNSDFWDRTDELEDIWDAIESGSHKVHTSIQNDYYFPPDLICYIAP